MKTEWTPNEILDLELKYKNDHDVLDMVEFIKSIDYDIDELRGELAEHLNTIDLLRDDVSEGEGKIDDLEDTITSLKEDIEELTEKLEKEKT